MAIILVHSLMASSCLLKSSGRTPVCTSNASKLAVLGQPRQTARPFLCIFSSLLHSPICQTDAAYSTCGITILLYNLIIFAGVIFSVFPTTVNPSWHDWKIVDWDVKPQHNQPTTVKAPRTLDAFLSTVSIWDWKVNLLSTITPRSLTSSEYFSTLLCSSTLGTTWFVSLVNRTYSVLLSISFSTWRNFGGPLSCTVLAPVDYFHFSRLCHHQQT